LAVTCVLSCGISMVTFLQFQRFMANITDKKLILGSPVRSNIH
jgi:hypothetical protein